LARCPWFQTSYFGAALPP